MARPYSSNPFGREFTRDEISAIRSNIRDEERLGSKVFALLKRMAGKLPFAEDALAAWFCARDPATPRRVRYTLLGALGYFVLPVDAMPDFLPLIGFTDDAAVIAAALATVAGAIRPEHRDKARETLAGL
ncbi:MAG: YkvA family protein [Bosea sp. (in: a-proteobacteria)]